MRRWVAGGRSVANRVRVCADLYQDENGTVYMTTNDLPGFPPTRLADGKGSHVVRNELARTPAPAEEDEPS